MAGAIILMAVTGILVLIAYSLGLAAGHRMSRWKEPIPSPKDLADAIRPEPKADTPPDKPESEDDEGAKMWQMFAAANPEKPTSKD